MIEPAFQPKTALVTTMLDFLEATDHKQIGSKNRLRSGPGSPEVLGVRSNHRPDLFCRNIRGRWVLLETVTREDMKDLEKLKDKLYLFSTAAQSYDWEFHIACFRAIESHVRGFCRKNDIRFSKLWDI